MASATATNVLCCAPVAGKRAVRSANVAAQITAPAAKMCSSVSLKGSTGGFQRVEMRSARQATVLRAITDTKEAAAEVEEKPEPALESDVSVPYARCEGQGPPPSGFNLFLNVALILPTRRSSRRAATRMGI
jgi:hypothetical protein